MAAAKRKAASKREAGGPVGFVPLFMAAADKSLERLHLAFPETPRGSDLFLVIHVDMRKNARVRAFVEHAFAALVAQRSLVEQAERNIDTLAVEDAVRLHGDDGVVLVDIRDIRELQRDGKVPGAFHCPRGMLEFWIDPESSYHKDVFAQDKRFVFFCAGGLRSALAADTAHRMGLKPVAHIRGGFGAWKKAGGPVENPPPKP